MPAVHVRTLTPTIGAVIEGVDVSTALDDEVVAAIRAALLKHRVVFFEDQILAAQGVKSPVPEEEYTIPLGAADVKRQGRDVTVIAIAKMVPEALAAAETLASEGIAVEVVDRLTVLPSGKTPFVIRDDV